MTVHPRTNIPIVLVPRRSAAPLRRPGISVQSLRLPGRGPLAPPPGKVRSSDEKNAETRSSRGSSDGVVQGVVRTAGVVVASGDGGDHGSAFGDDLAVDGHDEAVDGFEVVAVGGFEGVDVLALFGGRCESGGDHLVGVVVGVRRPEREGGEVGQLKGIVDLKVSSVIAGGVHHVGTESATQPLCFRQVSSSVLQNPLLNIVQLNRDDDFVFPVLGQFLLAVFLDSRRRHAGPIVQHGSLHSRRQHVERRFHRDRVDAKRYGGFGGRCVGGRRGDGGGDGAFGGVGGGGQGVGASSGSLGGGMRRGARGGGRDGGSGGRRRNGGRLRGLGSFDGRSGRHRSGGTVGGFVGGWRRGLWGGRIGRRAGRKFGRGTRGGRIRGRVGGRVGLRGSGRGSGRAGGGTGGDGRFGGNGRQEREIGFQVGWRS
mmetsp:Transcript_17951/g.36258  ORF Transcript_17951/g.36258 Transcript_17951/m.36258 type:complete len:426 (+) Transcript_17951:270-1547(+)